ncbi:MAG: hypothetical protein CL912_23185 [Deltaproteobacteria bacterium]|nr:hypothetical protein [Deltaproteobacteria bacterium]
MRVYFASELDEEFELFLRDLMFFIVLRYAGRSIRRSKVLWMQPSGGWSRHLNVTCATAEQETYS